ncbi:MAG: class I SAM-dependent methyltransferase [Halieaceae bacterium]
MRLGADGLELQALGEKMPGAVRVDFGAGKMRHRRRGGHNEPLGRAVGVGKWDGLSVVDATAGLGRDSFVLADLGCQVTMLERSAVVFALLRDGLDRARRCGDAWLLAVVQRMSAHCADSSQWLAQQGDACCDVVLLDPMFPQRKKSARVKKEMWLFQQLLEADTPQPGLLEQALHSARRRVVVKRPARAEPLEGRQPDFELAGKAVRFDVYNAA